MLMKRLLAVLVFLLFLGYVSALTPQEAMMEAWKTGNYSLVEPYLSGDMRKAFTEKTFSTIREGMVKEYGPVKGYELEKTEEKGGYQIYYYRVIAEKGNYTVSVTVKDGKVEGFHFAPKFNPEKALYPLLGGLLGLLLLWAYLRKFHAGELILGAVLILPVLVVQPPLQMLPGYAGISNAVLAVLWSGLIAGLVQEPLKYYFSRDKTLGRAVYIGAGFGLGEAIYVATISALFGGSLLGLFERTLALLFHASTTALFAYSYRNGWGGKALLAMVLVHWLTDSIAAYWHVNPSTAVLVAGYAVMLLTALAILPKLLPLARTESEEPEVRW
ncbi:DUF3887 domain-containing protein [Thermococcus sp. 9N3]|uniref:DUF3887 domain-containing protein n=1 Tax=Thermococcus sp. 9N3 TaxID=163002 RepID=UPI00143058C9|nr:DUF3887 domain-containing protein [Thermococcus sp. 9N3]NJE49318.1 DUF3887 domain-containing protein [Thermococcus sp. 9N3]